MMNKETDSILRLTYKGGIYLFFYSGDC